MQKLVYCPCCGTKIGKAEEIKNMESPCPKCRKQLTVNVTSKTVEVLLEVQSTEDGKEQQPLTARC